MSFNANGGTGTTSSVSCKITTTSSCSVTLPANGFTYGERTFNGWGTSSSATSGDLPGSNVTISANTTRYAIWSAVPAATCTLTLASREDQQTGSNIQYIEISPSTTSGVTYSFDGSTFNSTKTKDVDRSGTYTGYVKKDGVISSCSISLGWNSWYAVATYCLNSSDYSSNQIYTQTYAVDNNLGFYWENFFYFYPPVETGIGCQYYSGNYGRARQWSRKLIVN